MFIDTHAHLNFAAFKDDAEEVIKRTLEGGVFVINVGSQYSTSQRAVEIAEKYETGVWAAVGLHPIHVGNQQLTTDNQRQKEKFEYDKYKKLMQSPKVVAIGEMGFDYHHFMEGDSIEELKAKQKEVFLQSIKLANEIKKPMIIHCRDAYEDLYEIFKNNPVEKKGVVHSFVGGYKTARKFTELGYKIGLNGVITYSDSFNRLIKELDLKDIVLETDCPYLTPIPHKGERNEPLFVKLVAEKVAKIKEISVEEVAQVMTQNSKKLFDF